MAEYENYRRKEYDTYDIDTLRDYADEIIRVHCDPESALIGTDRASWDSEQASVTILKREKINDAFSYQFNVKDNTRLDNDRFIYLIAPGSNRVDQYDESGQILAEPSEYHAVMLMHYLRTQERVPVPQLTTAGKQKFAQLAANIAVQSAIQANAVDIPRLATAYNSQTGYEQLGKAVKCALDQVMEVNGVSLNYTSSADFVQRDIATRIYYYNQSFAIPQLPAADDPTQESDN